MRGIIIDSHQPSLHMARLPKISKYCWVWRSGAAGSVRESANDTPCIGSWSMPSTEVGWGMPAISRMVGPTSITWVKWERTAPWSRTRVGQWTTAGLRVPPRCEATCLPHWNGAFPAQAQAAEK